QILNPLCVTRTHVEDLEVLQFEKRIPEEEITLGPRIEKLFQSTDLQSLLDNCAQAVFEQSGFDRVLVYKFHDDLHGEVVAEKRNSEMDSFLGLHFPASDIPGPAREVFLDNWLRIVPDVNAASVPIFSKRDKLIDLGKVLIRAVSPIHIEYLQNMGVCASMTLSIIVEGKLWGLFACHDNTPKNISKTKRLQCSNLTQVASALIQSMILKSRKTELTRINKQLETIGRNLQENSNLSKDLINSTPGLLDLIDANGVCVALDEKYKWHTIGNVPPVKQLNVILDWLSTHVPNRPVFHTNSLHKHIPEFDSLKDIASGLLAISIPKTNSSYILWFRPEVIGEVKWAGNPDKPVNTKQDKLTPRSSFKAWKKVTNGTSKEWKDWELDAALDIRNFILAADIKDQFSKEQRAKRHAEEQKKAKEDLISMVSHDLRNPLNSIQISLELIEQMVTSDQEEILQLLHTAQRSIKTMEGITNNIVQTSKLDSTTPDLSKTKQKIEDVITHGVEMLTPDARKKGIRLLYQLNTNLEFEYDFNKILQVLSNLIGNALKFTPRDGEVRITAQQDSHNTITVSVCDSGPGVSKENIEHIFDRYWQAEQTQNLGSGLGLFIVKKIIDAHKGQVWVESEHAKGSCFKFKLPLN
ncbi:MAG: GAF domain-containing protein, partial [Bacteriovoracaceae bacterium]|nr:GAF domain-containing protein [Bacteriovoracaceae bacterium]